MTQENEIKRENIQSNTYLEQAQLIPADPDAAARSDSESLCNIFMVFTVKMP